MLAAVSPALVLNQLRLEVSVKAKNGLDFIVAATLVWAAIAGVWLLPNSTSRSGFITFFVGALTLPLARLLSKPLRTTWTLPHNPLQPLGLWLNFAQLFYFPLLMFMFGRYPQHFLMAYGIITGAHFFPYAWFYRAPAFAVMAGVISAGCLLLGLRLAPGQLYLIPAFVAVCLVVLAGLLVRSYRQNQRIYQPLAYAQS
ncbi:hypothetical protein MUN81_06030 [Hymenobacter sp. 5317J-9]|uniref:DUF7010 family protein n=1 Tax=Hymenobacter sp. 5317J-9 TaxID=2932250 RepID=UPI001FD713F7|nr:hypothetical protein [Hymenobacter sp. 5317J-9]UOQ99047.1 hypothetical protein MUN81_06030 [Hymenobacter sp. 5317J-9]